MNTYRVKAQMYVDAIVLVRELENGEIEILDIEEIEEIGEIENIRKF